MTTRTGPGNDWTVQPACVHPQKMTPKPKTQASTDAIP
jgi:hypothetical protein